MVLSYLAPVATGAEYERGLGARLKSRFGHLTANSKRRFAVSGFTLAVRLPIIGTKDSRVVARGLHLCFYSFPEY